MKTLQDYMKSVGEVPHVPTVADLTVPELDRHIAAVELAADSSHYGRRAAAGYALLALLNRRNELAPPQLPPVPANVVAQSLNEGPLPLTPPNEPLAAQAALILQAALAEAASNPSPNPQLV